MITEIIAVTAIVSSSITYLVMSFVHKRQKAKAVKSIPLEAPAPIPLEAPALPPVFGRIVQLSGSKFVLDKASGGGLNEGFAVFHKLGARTASKPREVATTEERAQFEAEIFKEFGQSKLTLKDLKSTGAYEELSTRFSDVELTAILTGTADLEVLQKLWSSAPSWDSLRDSRSIEEKIKETQELVRRAMSEFLSSERAIAREARKAKRKQ